MFTVYVVLCAFLLLISKTSAAGLFDKFLQNDYKIKFEHTDVSSYNKNMVKRLEVVTFKYNRTCAAVNGTYELNINLGHDMETIIQTYRFASNEYRLFPLRFQVNSCLAISKNVAGLKNFSNCGNFTGCPLQKGKMVRICNWTIDESKFPPLIPDGRYMVDTQFIYNNREVALLKFYIEIFRPISVT